MRMDQMRDRLQEVIRRIADLSEALSLLDSSSSTSTGGPDPVEQARIRRELEALNREKQALNSDILQMLGLRTHASLEGIDRPPTGGAPRTSRDVGGVHDERSFPRPDRARAFEPSTRPRQEEALPRLLSPAPDPQPRSLLPHRQPNPRLPWGAVDVGHRASAAAGGDEKLSGERSEVADPHMPLGASRSKRLGAILPSPFTGSEVPSPTSATTPAAVRSLEATQHHRRYASADPALSRHYYGGGYDEEERRSLLPPSPSLPRPYSYTHSTSQSSQMQPWSYAGTRQMRGPDAQRDDRDREIARRGLLRGVASVEGDPRGPSWEPGPTPGRGAAIAVDPFSAPEPKRSRERPTITSGRGTGGGSRVGGGTLPSSFSFRGESEERGSLLPATGGADPYIQRGESGVPSAPSPSMQPPSRLVQPETYALRSRASSPFLSPALPAVDVSRRRSSDPTFRRESTWQQQQQQLEARARSESSVGWEGRGSGARSSTFASAGRWTEERRLSPPPAMYHRPEELAEERHHHEQLSRYRSFYSSEATPVESTPPRLGSRATLLPPPEAYVGISPTSQSLAVSAEDLSQALYPRFPGLLPGPGSAARAVGGVGASTLGRQPLPSVEAVGSRWRSEPMGRRDQRRQDPGNPPSASTSSSGRGCQEPDCDRRPIYAYKGSKKAAFCARHRVAGMVDTRHPLCKNEQCTRQPSFGMEGDRRASYCAEHKLPGMINVSSRRCQHTGCLRHPNFGFPGDRRATYCSGHREPGMVDIVSRRCREPECGRRPLYNFDGLRPVCCSQHKEPGMIDVVSTRCQEPGCFCHPSFGYPSDKKARRCARHRLENMVGVKGHRHKRRREAASSASSTSASAGLSAPTVASAATELRSSSTFTAATPADVGATGAGARSLPVLTRGGSDPAPSADPAAAGVVSSTTSSPSGGVAREAGASAPASTPSSSV